MNGSGRRYGGLIAGLIIGILIAGVVQAVLYWYESGKSCSKVRSILVNDLRAIQAADELRLKDWPEQMERLRNTKNPRTDTNARRWLMPEALLATPSRVFSATIGNLGHLGEPAIAQTIRTYKLRAQLNAEIRILASPDMLNSGPTDRIWLIARNLNTQKDWDVAVKATLRRLENVGCWR